MGLFQEFFRMCCSIFISLLVCFILIPLVNGGVWIKCTYETTVGAVSSISCDGILRDFQLTMHQLRQLNPDLDCNKLKMGDRVCVSGQHSEAYRFEATVDNDNNNEYDNKWKDWSFFARCTNKHKIRKSDSCSSILDRFDLTMDQLNLFNPHLDCDMLPNRYMYGKRICVASSQTETHQMSAGCTYRHIATRDGETCNSVSTTYRLTMNRLKQLNHDIDCDSNLEFAQRVCVAGQPSVRARLDNFLADIGLTKEQRSEWTSLSKADAETSAKDIFSKAEDLSRNVYYFTNGLSKSDRLKWLQSIYGSAALAVAFIDLVFPAADPIMEAIEKLRSFIEQKFDKLTKVIDAGFKEVERRMDFHHYRNNVLSKINKGIGRLHDVMKVASSHNKKLFTDWCTADQPHEIAQDILDRISTYPNMLSSYSSHANIEYDRHAYTTLEKSILEQVVTLEMLTGYCVGYLKLKKNDVNQRFEKIYNISVGISNALNKGRDDLKQYWPNSVRRIAERELDAGGENQGAARRIEVQLNAKYAEIFFVAVYDGVTGYDEHTIFANDNRATYRFRYQTEHGHLKNYVIFRTNCSRPGMRGEIVEILDSPTPANKRHLFPVKDAEGLASAFNQLIPSTSMILVVAKGNNLGMSLVACTKEKGTSKAWTGRHLHYAIGLD